jgi:3'-5' exoribonuclease
MGADRCQKGRVSTASAAILRSVYRASQMPTQQQLGARTTVKQLLAGGPVADVYRVGNVQRQTGRTGRDFLRLTLIDMSGQITAMVWDDVDRLSEVLTPGADVFVTGAAEINERWGPQVKIRDARPAEPEECDPTELEEQPLFSVDRMIEEFRALIDSVRQPHLVQLLEALLGEGTDAWATFLEAPAAKVNHQAYRHGLLEHTLTVAQTVAAAAEVFPGIDRDLAVCGALIHDIGKLDAYTSSGGAADLTDDGKLQGEIPLGYYRVRHEIEQIDGFPPALARALLHIQLSHHGRLEHGSPVEPAIREAVLVHMIDNLGGTLGSFDRLEKTLAPGSEWSQRDFAIGGSAWFGHHS